MKLRVNEDGLPVLEQFSEEGFVDCVLQIQNVRTESDHICFHMAASFKGLPVGVDVRVFREIKAGFNENMELNRDNVYRDGVQFSRSGPESDRLVSAIAHLYESGVPTERMVEVEAFTAIALHQGEIDIQSQAIKLFGNDRQTDNEDDYYESFFNLDLPNGLVFWNEKDQEYRQPLVRSLSGDVA